MANEGDIIRYSAGDHAYGMDNNPPSKISQYDIITVGIFL